jgi:hypothetical protein
LNNKAKHILFDINSDEINNNKIKIINVEKEDDQNII